MNTEIRNIDRNIEAETDIQAIIQIVESEFQRFREDSRFIIGVKTRATANILSKKLPAYLRCTNLTGLYRSAEEGGNTFNNIYKLYDLVCVRLALQQTLF